MVITKRNNHCSISRNPESDKFTYAYASSVCRTNRGPK